MVNLDQLHAKGATRVLAPLQLQNGSRSTHVNQAQLSTCR
jgi:hypothetical protein